jgi:hypothetical protein
MRKIVIVYGTIAGLLMDLMFLISFWMMEKGMITFENSELFGYASMIIVLSLIFMGVRSYRNNHLNGVMTFGGGVKAGFLIAGIAALFYAGGWEVYYNTVPGMKETFLERYAEMSRKKMQHEGASPEKIEAKMKELKQMAEWYKNPFLRFGMTLAEILPVGIVVSLISAGILRKKGVLPA